MAIYTKNNLEKSKESVSRGAECIYLLNLKSWQNGWGKFAGNYR
ncbi:MAG: palindromic element RPE5 domain-containing protein [Rickettsia endosymbiont of Glossina mortisans submortisans]|nr:palindromic element RPE5 domain-containing protein [Rickettsia endosymbiont of Glossina mortisans submortisans]